jgi:hypothetical protein
MQGHARYRRLSFVVLVALAAIVLMAFASSVRAAPRSPRPAPGVSPVNFQPRSLDGSGNNLAHPTWGQVGTNYQRLAPAR